MDFGRVICLPVPYNGAQPIVSLEGGTLRGFEALVRWRHPELGFISPADFIPVAEDTGLIIPIGAWVLREACHQMRRWREAFPADPPLFMSVNLSGKQFAHAGLIDEVAAILRETGLDPRSLKLEITESVVMESIETATGMLKELRSLGAQLSIDDFGTTGHTWHDREVLLALLPLVILVGLLPIKFPLPSR